jgi:hypothetical protein
MIKRHRLASVPCKLERVQLSFRLLPGGLETLTRITAFYKGFCRFVNTWTVGNPFPFAFSAFCPVMPRVGRK